MIVKRLKVLKMLFKITPPHQWLTQWMLRRYHWLNKHGVSFGIIEKKFSARVNENRFRERAKYFSELREIFRPTTSIICNNCFGGRISQDLGYPYNSPTAGLEFTNEDFAIFVKNLPEVINLPLERVETPRHFPVPTAEIPFGKIKCKGHDIEIRFTHYKNWEEACEKWNRRCKRINFDDLVVIEAPVQPANVEAVYNLLEASIQCRKVFLSHIELPVDDKRFQYVRECGSMATMAPYQEAHLLYPYLVKGLNNQTESGLPKVSPGL